MIKKALTSLRTSLSTVVLRKGWHDVEKEKWKWHTNVNSFSFTCLPVVSNVICEGVIWIWGTEESLDAQQNCSNLESRAPLVFQDVKADSKKEKGKEWKIIPIPPQLVNVWMVNLCEKSYFWCNLGLRSEEKFFRKENYEPSGILPWGRAPNWKHLPRKEIAKDQLWPHWNIYSCLHVEWHRFPELKWENISSWKKLICKRGSDCNLAVSLVIRVVVAIGSDWVNPNSNFSQPNKQVWRFPLFNPGRWDGKNTTSRNNSGSG